MNEEVELPTLSELFKKAVGTSDTIISVNLDVRGFSAFSTRVESVEVALYLKRIFLATLGRFFKSRTFVKSTGDGLMIIVPYNERNFVRRFNQVIVDSLAVLDTFSSICDGDPLINFETPANVGIGISRGSACKIVSEGRVVDYAGRVLNLTARLMDLARPAGVVFEGINLAILGEPLRGNFASKHVFLRGVSESAPIEIFYTKDATIIPDRWEKPLEDATYQSLKRSDTLANMRKFKTFAMPLDPTPINKEDILVVMKYPVYYNGELQNDVRARKVITKFTCKKEAGEFFISFPFQEFAGELAEDGVQDADLVSFEIRYVPRN